MTDRAPQDQDKYVLRFPDGMRDRLKGIAETNGRSLNAEIVTRLEASLASGDNGSSFDAIFENVISTIAGRKDADRHVGLLMADYADYKQDQIHRLREFLLLVSDAHAELDGRPARNIQEHLAQQRELEMENLRSWAHSLGFELVPTRPKPEGDDGWDWSNLETPQLPRTNKARKPAKKKA